ncbi:protein of unknown function DUF134 [Methanolacinia petrolearia DSM 11571]|uniref:Uncharacterized protein n=1 Tax=Methanolacinia petrolearia (strain DSM 11571 / OCM 486 / SEBR 4847) TaxID=679926 RepID=E1RDA5_METP4|nr:DUF134 domain-containing protein [Methanolacinia petrolearia]ADN37088.1 protein of unknown function DUF134 [Methanolacinia petrolearia DSM 11571]
MTPEERGPDSKGAGCRRRGRGRPRVPRTIGENVGSFHCYGPLCRSCEGEDMTVVLYPEEIGIIRLVDLMGYDQESAAAEIGVSRKTLWRDLHDARRKIADALVNGKMIRVVGCRREMKGECPENNIPQDDEEDLS